MRKVHRGLNRPLRHEGSPCAELENNLYEMEDAYLLIVLHSTTHICITNPSENLIEV